MINVTHLRIKDVCSTRRTPNSPFHALLLPAVPCFAFQLALLMKCKMMRYRATYLLLSLIAVRIVTVNGTPETHGLPDFARCMPVLLDSWWVFSCRFVMLVL